jgi:hypothetical protein
MPTLQIKKNTFSDRKKLEAYERYAKAKWVNLPALIEDRYGINFSFGGSGKNGDAESHGLRVALTHDKQSGDKVWLANGTAQGNAVQVIMQLDKHHLNTDTSKNDAIKIIETFKLSNKDTELQGNEINNTHNNEVSKLLSIKLPERSDRNDDQVFEYVISRGVSWSTVTTAESTGFLQRSKQGLTFVGRDENGVVKQAETRLLKPFFTDSGKEMRFKCVEGSDRSYPPILPSVKDSDTIHLVEGGFDALGLREYLSRESKDDTIIMTGGKDNINYLSHAHIKQLLENKTVNIWRDHEKSEIVQVEADVAFNKTIEALKAINVKEITVSTPPVGIKDIAELNKFKKEQLLVQRRQEQSQSKSM